MAVNLGERAIVWGGNYFTERLPASESWLIWIKRPDGFNFDHDNTILQVKQALQEKEGIMID